MKKLLCALTAAVLALSVLGAACAYSVPLPELGLILEVPENGASGSNIVMELPDYDPGLSFYYYNQQALSPYLEQYRQELSLGDADATAAAEDAYTARLALHCQLLYTILGLPAGTDAPEGATALGANSTHTYYAVPGSENASLAEEDRPLLEEARAWVSQLIAGVTVTEIGSSGETGISDLMAGFSTVDMDGNPVDASVFAKADLTVLHIWGTFCSPCISEMPDIAVWADGLPDSVQVLGLIVDVSSPGDRTYASAEKILAASGATFVNILSNESLNTMLSGIVGVPTTLFLDSHGNAAASPVVGADLESCRQTVENLLPR